MGLHKLFRLVALVLSLIGIGFYAFIFFKGDSVITNTGEGVAGFIYVAYTVLIISLILTLLYTFIQLFSNKDSLKKSLISVGLFLLIVVVSYFISNSDAEIVMVDGAQVLSESGSRWVGVGLRTFYFLVVIAIGLMVFSGIKKLVKN